MPKPIPIVKVVSVRRAFAAVLDEHNNATGNYFDETWVVTDEEWLRARRE